MSKRVREPVEKRPVSIPGVPFPLSRGMDITYDGRKIRVREDGTAEERGILGWKQIETG